MFGMPSSGTPEQATASLVSGTLNAFASIAVVFTIIRYRGLGWSSIGLNYSQKDWAPGVVLFLASWLAYSLTVYLFAYLSAFWPVFRPPLEILEISTLQSADHRFLLLYMLVNPWFEEILVRGFIATEFESISGRKWVGIWGSTIFQGAYHLYRGWTLAVSQSVGFLLFAIYFAKTRRLYPVIIAHALADLLAYMYMVR